MFNLLILSFMDAVQPEPASTRAHQGHALSIGFGLVLIGIAVDSLRWDNGRAYESQHVIQPTIAQRQNIAEI